MVGIALATAKQVFLRLERVVHAVTWLLRCARATGLSLAPRMILPSCQEGPVVVELQPGVCMDHVLYGSCHQNNANVFSFAL